MAARRLILLVSPGAILRLAVLRVLYAQLALIVRGLDGRHVLHVVLVLIVLVLVLPVARYVVMEDTLLYLEQVFVLFVQAGRIPLGQLPPLVRAAVQVFLLLILDPLRAIHALQENIAARGVVAVQVVPRVLIAI